MPNRTAKFVSAIFASILAGVPLAGLPHGAARAADDCLSGPNDETPEGSHWYYRIDHATKRHCWYLRQEGDKPSQTAAPNSSRSAGPVAPKAETATPHTIADAHAELPAQKRTEQPDRNQVLIPALPADAAAGENNTDAPGAEVLRSVVAARWPALSGMSSAASPPAAPGSLAADPQPNPAAPPAAVAAVPLAATISPQARSVSIPMLLGVMTGALALAGVTASLVLKFGGQRLPRQAKLRVRRDTIWERTDDHSMLSPHPHADVLPRRTGFPRDLDQADDANVRVAEFFARLSRRAST